MNSPVMFLYYCAHDRVDRKLIASRMDTQFQVFRQAEFSDGIVDHKDILFEFFSELYRVAFVVYSLVEPACKLWSNGLNRHLQVGESFQDEEHIKRFLRFIDFVHRYFGDKIAFALHRGYMS